MVSMATIHVPYFSIICFLNHIQLCIIGHVKWVWSILRCVACVPEEYQDKLAPIVTTTTLLHAVHVEIHVIGPHGHHTT